MIKTNIFLLILMLGISPACNNLYKAGNLYYLGIPIETNLNYNLIRSYTDTLKLKYNFGAPQKWKYEDKLVDIDSVNHKIIYFSKDPEEMYLVSISGQLLLGDVYNENIKMGGWVTEKKLLTEGEKLRIMNRFKNEYLLLIEQLAKKNGLPDSLIYSSR